jgi:2-phospho-L-lactate/phosphoenolpyruvate guanylyltransferase
MNIWAVIPVKPAEEGKSRLADVLNRAQRMRLNRYLFRQTLAIACSVFAPERVIVVSRDIALLGIAAAAGAQAITERGTDLNQALHQAALLPPMNDGLLAVSADLPNLTADDLRAMIEPPGPVVIAPDRARQGTNAILTSPAACIPFRFGEDSFSLHCAEAGRIGVTPRIVSRPGLAYDLDTQEDLALHPGLISI